MTVFSILLVLFVTLKLLGLIAWSWLWVLSPLWVGVAFWVIWLGVLFVLAAYATGRR